MKQKILIYITLTLIFGLALGLNANAQPSPTSMVINYDLTKVDRDLKPGDSGTLIAVIQNTGGLPAKEVKASILYTSGLSASDTWYLGTINPGQSVTVTTRISVPDNTKAGTYLLTLKIDYEAESYDSRGILKTEEEESQWKIPIQVYGDANFQVTVEKTDFYKDIASEFIIKGSSKGEMRNVYAELYSTPILESTSGSVDVSSISSTGTASATATGSNCASVIGSEKVYLGNLDANQNFILNYTIKPNTVGICSISINFDYNSAAGGIASEYIRVGLSVMEPDVDLKILDVGFGTPSPGDAIDLKIKIKNVGAVSAESVTATLDLNDPFVPVQTSELYIENINAGEEKEISFKISINPDAEIKAYKIPLKINYKIGGVEYKDNKSIGVDIAGSVNLEVINVEIVRDKLRIEVANTGTRTANSVKATLTSGDLTKISYKDKLIPTKQTTFSFDVPREKTGKLVLEYTGSGNTRVSISEDIPIPSNSLLSTSQENSSTGFPLWAIAVIVIILAAVIYKFRKQF